MENVALFHICMLSPMQGIKAHAMDAAQVFLEHFPILKEIRLWAAAI